MVFMPEKTITLSGKVGKGLLPDQSVSRVLYGNPKGCRDGHFSRSAIARTLQQPTRGVFIEVGCSRRILGLAPAGVYRAVHVATHAVGSYPTFSPLPSFEGGLFSVALSVMNRPESVMPRHYLAAFPTEPGLSSN